MKKINKVAITTIVGLFLGNKMAAQSTTTTNAQKEENKMNVQLYGFVRTDIFRDTRQMIGVGESLAPLYPRDRLSDINQEDINDAPKFHILPILSRVGINAKGPVLMGAKTEGVIEGEFFGSTEAGVNEFRMRLAYMTFDWKNTQLGIGQYWHPFKALEIFPGVVNYSGGAPIFALNRNPQIRLTQALSKNIRVIAALHSHRDFTANTEPYRNSGMPAAHLQIQYKSDKFMAGVATQYENVKPKLSVGTPILKSNERAESTSFMAFSALITKPIKVTLTGYLMQNAASYTQLGGIVGYQATPQSLEIYKPTNSASIWMDLQQTTANKLTFGLYTGYIKNNGVKNPIENTVATAYGGTANWGVISATPGGRTINYLYKISPRADYTLGKVLKFRFEFETTVAQWADATIKGNGTENIYMAKNQRLQLAALYHF